jgi:hypothetical protein
MKNSNTLSPLYSLCRLSVSVAIIGLFSLLNGTNLNAQGDIHQSVLDKYSTGNSANTALNIFRLDIKLDSLMLRTDSLRQGGGVILAESIDVDGISDLDVTDIDGTLDVLGASTLNDGLSVTAGTTSFISSEQIVFDVSLDRATLEAANGDVSMQLIPSSFPVLIKGSEQGLAIEVKSQWGTETEFDNRSHRGNNYVSFWRRDYNDALEQTGRIEGMGDADLGIENLIAVLTPMVTEIPPFLGALVSLDPMDVMYSGGGLMAKSALFPASLFLDINIGELPTINFSGGSLPSLTGGSLPSLSGGSIGSLPSLSGGSFDVVPLDISFPTLSSGSLPTLPTLNVGSLPTLNVGSLPTVTFSGGELPSIGLSAGLLALLEGDILGFISGTGQTGLGFDTDAYALFSDVANKLYSRPNSAAGVEIGSNTYWDTWKTNLNASSVYGETDADLKASMLYSNYSQDVLSATIGLMATMAQQASALMSPLDPEDIVSAAIALVSESNQLILLTGFSQANLGISFESGAGDYAEWLARFDQDETLNCGEIVGIIGGKVSKTFEHAEKFMVISTAPIVLGNMPTAQEGESSMEKVAFMGQVPVRVTGNVEIGDYILPSGNSDGFGIAVNPTHMKALDYKRIVGVAWEQSNPENYVNSINTAVGINQDNMGDVIDEMQQTLNVIQTSLEKLDRRFIARLYNTSGKGKVAGKRKAAKDKMNSEMNSEMTVSSTHPDKIEQYFRNKSFEADLDMRAKVEIALKEMTGIDLKSYPLIDFMISNPQLSNEMVTYFETGISTMTSLMEPSSTNEAIQCKNVTE